MHACSSVRGLPATPPPPNASDVIGLVTIHIEHSYRPTLYLYVWIIYNSQWMSVRTMRLTKSVEKWEISRMSLLKLRLTSTSSCASIGLWLMSASYTRHVTGVTSCVTSLWRRARHSLDTTARVTSLRDVMWPVDDVTWFCRDVIGSSVAVSKHDCMHCQEKSRTRCAPDMMNSHAPP